MNGYQIVSEALSGNTTRVYHMTDKKNLPSIMKHGLNPKFTGSNYKEWFAPIVAGIYVSPNLPHLLKWRDQEVLVTCIVDFNSLLVDEDKFKEWYGEAIINLLGYPKLSKLSKKKLVKHDDYVKDMIILHDNPNHKDMIKKIKSLNIIPGFSPSNKDTIAIIQSTTTTELASLKYHHKHGQPSKPLKDTDVKIDVKVMRKGLTILVRHSNSWVKKYFNTHKGGETTYIVPTTPKIEKIELVKSNKIIKQVYPL